LRARRSAYRYLDPVSVSISVMGAGLGLYLLRVGGDPAILVAAAVLLSGAVLAFRSALAGSAIVVFGSLLVSLRTPSQASEAVLVASGVLGVVLAGSPSVSRAHMARVLLFPLPFAVYAVVVWVGASGSVSEHSTALAYEQGKGLFLVLLSLMMAAVLGSVMTPGRSYPRVRGFVRFTRRRLDFFLVVAVLIIVAASVRVIPVSLILVLAAAVAYVWARLMGASRVEAIAVFTTVFVLGLYLTGAASAVDSVLSGG